MEWLNWVIGIAGSLLLIILIFKYFYDIILTIIILAGLFWALSFAGLIFAVQAFNDGNLWLGYTIIIFDLVVLAYFIFKPKENNYHI